MIKYINESIQTHQDMDLLCEEYFVGHELDLDILIQDNQIKFMLITDNLEASEPFFFEQGFLF